MIRLFVSSVQSEFIDERKALREAITQDLLLSQFFEVFLFESKHATDKTAKEVYLKEVDQSEIYIGLFGKEYGEVNKGVSPTEAEFDRATKAGKHRLIYLKEMPKSSRDIKMRKLIKKANSQVVRKSFKTLDELIGHVKESLVAYMKAKKVYEDESYLEQFVDENNIKDIDTNLVKEFAANANSLRNTTFSEHDIRGTLTSLKMLKDGNLRRSAIFTFGKDPQLDLLPSEVKCMAFEGKTKAAEIFDHDIYKGNVWSLIDQAVAFVRKNLRRRVGRADNTAKTPREYEIPEQVFREAIVNAIVHRNYGSNESVEVRIFSDRFEVANPAFAAAVPSLIDLRKGDSSKPHNPTLAEVLYQLKYIEKFGTGIKNMIEMCVGAGLNEPELSKENGFVITIFRSILESTPQAPRKHPASTKDAVHY